MKVYIAGPITGVEDYYDNFESACAKLEGLGHKVMNPAHLPEGFEWGEYMPICFAMIDACEIVVLLDGWKESKGACMEKDYAMDRGLLVAEYDGLVGKKYVSPLFIGPFKRISVSK